MKKLSRVFIGFAALTVMMLCMTVTAFAGTAEDKVTVSMRAGAPGTIDYINESLEVTGDLVEKYFPDLAEYDVADGVSFADALVAAHIAKYGEDNVTDYLGMSYNASWGTVSMQKQFGHDIVGFYYLYDEAIPVVATSQEISDGDRLFAGSYADYNYADLYSYFDAETMRVGIGTEAELYIQCDNGGQGVIPETAELKLVDPETGSMTAVEGAKYDPQTGAITFKFDKKGVYYVSATGSVKYTGSWEGAEETTAAFAGAYAKVVVAPMDSVKVNFKAGTPGSFDYINENLKVDGYLAEEYFPEIAEYDVADGVSYADALVAAHIKKYGEAKVRDNLGMAYNPGWGTVSMQKQFGHNAVGFYYLNGTATPVVATSQKIEAKDKLFAGSYADYNYLDLYSYFGKETVNTVTGKNVSLKLSCDNGGTAVAPITAKVMKLNRSTGKLTAISGAEYANGKVTFKFAKKGTYYISATGTVKYVPSWTTDEKEGKIAGAYCKVVVKDAKPAKPVFKSVKRNTKKKATVVWKKAKNAKKYQVQYRMKGKKKWTTKTTAKTKIVIKKLKAKKAYQVRVRAINGSAKSAYSKIRLIKKK